MKRWFSPTGPGALALAASLVLLAPGLAAAQARDNAAGTSVEERYRADRAACLRQADGPARADCLRELAAARASARSAGARVDQSPEALARNALQRCQPLSGERRSLCERMARGEGDAAGSVESGGVLRTLETEEAVAPAEVPLAPGVVVPAPDPATPAASPVR